MNSHVQAPCSVIPDISEKSADSPQTPKVGDRPKSDKIQIGIKTFVFALDQNSRGLFLRITEAVNGRRNTIIIPGTGLEDFKKHLDDLVQAAKQGPLTITNERSETK